MFISFSCERSREMRPSVATSAAVSMSGDAVPVVAVVGIRAIADLAALGTAAAAAATVAALGTSAAVAALAAVLAITAAAPIAALLPAAAAPLRTLPFRTLSLRPVRALSLRTVRPLLSLVGGPWRGPRARTRCRRGIGTGLDAFGRRLRRLLRALFRSLRGRGSGLVLLDLLVGVRHL
jgi:hypothetical protein